MKFFKGMLLGSVLTASMVNLYYENPNSLKKMIGKRGKKIIKNIKL